jgi:hypothetical protein
MFLGFRIRIRSSELRIRILSIIKQNQSENAISPPLCNNPGPLLDGGLSPLYGITFSKDQIQAISHLSVTTPVRLLMVDSVPRDNKSSSSCSKSTSIGVLLSSSSPLARSPAALPLPSSVEYRYKKYHDKQCRGSGSGLDPDSTGSLDLYPYPVPGGQK